MDKLFLTILNMSLTGTFAIAAICLARLPLKKAPKIISYSLWAVAGFRLLFPFSIESVFSLMPFKAQTIPTDIATQAVPRIDSGIPFVNNAVSGILPTATPSVSVNPLQIWTEIGTWIWFVGFAVMLIYGVVSFIILKHKMKFASNIEANIFEADNIQSPFVLGMFTPKIYLPVGLSENEYGYILLHEQTHIRRCDHIVKFVAYFIMCLHWFNPLAWAAFLLMGVDMEMSCDERVLKEMGSETKKDYSLSLLSFASERRVIGGSPLAFGEGGIKVRVKNVLKFKKPSRMILFTAISLLAVLSIGFAVNRAQSDGPADSNITAEAAIEQLANSINHKDGAIYFQIPSEYPNPENWNINITGRAEFEDGFSMSVHEFDNINESRAWEAGMLYSFLIEGRGLVNLDMHIYLPDEKSETLEYYINLLDLTPELVLPAFQENKPVLTLYGYDENTDNGDTDEAKKHFTERLLPEAETGWTRLTTDTIFIEIQIPDGTVAAQIYYAETGTEMPEHILFDSKYSTPHKNLPTPAGHPRGTAWRFTDEYPDGFIGHIWAVTTDTAGAEHYGDGIVKVFYEPQEATSPVNIAGIMAIDGNTLQLTEVEVLMLGDEDTLPFSHIKSLGAAVKMNDTTRMAELGLNESDFPGWYYIHHTGKDAVAYEINDETIFTFVDTNLLFVGEENSDRIYTTTDKDEYIQHLSVYYNPPNPPYVVFLQVDNGIVLSLTEVFLFTQ